MTAIARALLIVTLFAALLGAPARGFADNRVTYTLALNPPKAVLQAKSADARRSYADLTEQQLTLRLEAAGVKEFAFHPNRAGTLVMETGWGHDPAWMEALLTAPGQVDLREVRPAKVDWLPLASTMPEGIEVRGDEVPYLWSSSRDRLQKFLARITIAEGKVLVFVEDGGFRSVTLGASLGSRKQIARSSARTTPRGGSFVELQFADSVRGRLADTSAVGVEKVAIVLDGEVVGFVSAKSIRERTASRLAAPNEVVRSDRAAQALWVRQVAGRLAASLPIAVAILKE